VPAILLVARALSPAFQKNSDRVLTIIFAAAIGWTARTVTGQNRGAFAAAPDALNTPRDETRAVLILGRFSGTRACPIYRISGFFLHPVHPVIPSKSKSNLFRHA